jgi:hypothetical protein
LGDKLGDELASIRESWIPKLGRVED